MGIDDNGNKVWAGNEDCEDVTWQECKLVERTVDFTVPKVDCLDDGNAIPYMRFVDTNKTQMLNKMTCEVKSANHASLLLQQSVPLLNIKSVLKLLWKSAK